MKRVREEDGSPMESANNSGNVIKMEKSVMENSRSGDKFVKVDKMGEKHRRNGTLKQLKMIEQKKKQRVQRKTKALAKQKHMQQLAMKTTLAHIFSRIPVAKPIELSQKSGPKGVKTKTSITVCISRWRSV